MPSKHTPLREMLANPPKGLPQNIRKNLAAGAIVFALLGILSFSFYYFGGFGGDLRRGTVKTLAVIPFENVNGDSEQDYFSDGITEDIVNHLIKIQDLSVKSRTSTVHYKATTKSISEIGKELGVENILQGSVLKTGDNLSVAVKLVDVEKEKDLWSEKYDRELDDILELQSEIAVEVASALNARITQNERKSIQAKASDDFRAYDYFLKARDVVNRGPMGWMKQDVDRAMALINEALKLDPNFSSAIALKGRIWYYSSYWGTENKVWQDSTLFYASRAIEVSPTSPDGYRLRGDLYRELGNYEKAAPDFKKMHELAPHNPELMFDYGLQLLRQKDEHGADLILRSIHSNYQALDPEYYRQLSNVYFYLGDLQAEMKLLEKAKSLDPGSMGGALMMAAVLVRNGQYEEAIKELNSTNSEERWVLDQLAWAYYLNKNHDEAAEKWNQMSEIEEQFEDTTQTLPYRHRLGMVYRQMGRKQEADSLIREQLEISADIISGARGMGTWGNLAEAYYDQGICLSYFGRNREAVQALDSAWRYRFSFYWGWLNDPLLENLRGRSDFEAIIAKIEAEFDFWRDSFANALKRAEADDQLKGLMNK